MGRLPPAEKLPLALRKNIRDEWDNNKADLEKQLSDVLGTSWTIVVNPNAIWPYHNDGYAKESLGDCIKAYVEGAVYQLKYVAGKLGDHFKQEINAICHEHVLTLDVEEANPPRFSYDGCDVRDGKLRVLFVENYLGTNVSDACQEDTLLKALNDAPAPPAGAASNTSFAVRTSIRTDYDPHVDAVRAKIAALLHRPAEQITLNPNFEANFAALAKASSGSGAARDDWQRNLGDFTLRYFDALAYQMKYLQVGEDELVREGMLEAVSTNEYAFRIVDALKYDSYCECDVEDGVLYLQCTPAYFGTNIDYVASKLMDRL